MAYDSNLANRVREYLYKIDDLPIVEKTMFGGLAFMVRGKMCINVVGNRLMCRFDPVLTEQLASKGAFVPMIMRRKEYRGYCKVEPFGYQNQSDFEFWINLCLDYNDKAKSSKHKQCNDKKRGVVLAT